MNDIYLNADKILHEIFFYPLRYIKTALVFFSRTYKSDYFSILSAHLNKDNADDHFSSFKLHNFVSPPAFCIITAILIAVSTKWLFQLMGSPFSYAIDLSFIGFRELSNTTSVIYVTLFISLIVMAIVATILFRIKIMLLRWFKRSPKHSLPKYLLDSFSNQFIIFFYYLCFALPLIYLLISSLLALITLEADFDHNKYIYHTIIITTFIVILHILISLAFDAHIWNKDNRVKNVFNTIKVSIKATFKLIVLLLSFSFINMTMKTIILPDLVQAENTVGYITEKRSIQLKRASEGKTSDYCQLCNFDILTNDKSDFKYSNLEILRRSSSPEARSIYHNFMGTVYLCKAYELVYCSHTEDYGEQQSSEIEYLIRIIYDAWESRYIYCDHVIDLIINKISETEVGSRSDAEVVAPELYLNESIKYFQKAKTEVDQMETMRTLKCLYPE